MPNWCSNGITFYSDNEEQIRKMFQDFIAIINGEESTPNGFGSGWMGDFANKYFEDIGHDKIDCRGSVNFISSDVVKTNEYWCFNISTETAWSAKMGLWWKIIEQFYPDVSMAYISEECGNCYFLKYDETGLFYGDDDYYMDGCFPPKDGVSYYVDEHGFSSIEDIFYFLEESLPFKFRRCENYQVFEERINEKLQELDGYDEGYYIQIGKYQDMHPAEFSFLR